MIFEGTGKASDDLYVLGTSPSPIYLITGKRAVLFEAGITCLGPLYVDEIKKVLGPQQPAYLFLTHMHFDHCGAAAYLKHHFPKLKIVASQKAAAILKRPNAIATIAQLSREVRQLVDRETPGIARAIEFEPFVIDRIASDGDRIQVGNDLTVEIMETPGHTWDSLSFYIPEKQWIFSAEAGGLLGPAGFFTTEFIADFDAYMQSLERLAALDLEMVCQSHFQLFFGEDARTFYTRSIQAAMAFKNQVMTLLDQENGNIESVVALIKADEYDRMPPPKQPLSAYLLNLNARVRHLAAKA
jgi:glyoxylase-like metal-dependent hydrolase (beta-lactamase superfamily II)